MRIKSKLLAVALLPLLVFVSTAAIEYYTNRVNVNRYARGAVIIEIIQRTQNLVSLTYEYGITRGDRAATQWRNQYARLERILAEMPAFFGRPVADPQLMELREHFHNAATLFAEIQTYDNRQPLDGRTVSASGVRSNLINRVILELQSGLPLTDKFHAEIVQSIKKSIHYGFLLTSGIILLLALVLLALSFLITGGINRSLSRLQQAMATVAGGDLACRVNLETKDELGDLGRGFDAMTAKLAALTVSRDDLAREVAERTRAEAALGASETQLKAAQRMAKLGSWELDLTTNTLRWSEETCRIFEIDPQEFDASYEAFIAAIHPDDREEVNQAYAGSLQKKTPYEIEHRLLMKEGRIKFVHERCETLFADDGSPLRSLGTVQDITARRLAELEISRFNEELEGRVGERTLELEMKTMEVEETQQALMNIVEDLNLKTVEIETANLRLQEMDRLKSLFIASMSHELRTPLNSVIGFSSILLEEWLGPLNAEQKAKMAIVLRTGKHLLSLINDLIDISKIEAGKLESVVEEFDLHDLFMEAASLNEAELTGRGIDLRVEAIHLPMVTDRRRLYQCIVNLLGNAVKFTRQGAIAVRAALGQGSGVAGKGEMVTITVKDTGIGIREEDLPKLFASFVRLPLPEDMQAKGTGLGLYLVKKIVTDILRGTVSVTSVHGQGSEFSLTVPVRIKS